MSVDLCFSLNIFLFIFNTCIFTKKKALFQVPCITYFHSPRKIFFISLMIHYCKLCFYLLDYYKIRNVVVTRMDEMFLCHVIFIIYGSLCNISVWLEHNHTICFILGACVFSILQHKFLKCWIAVILLGIID
jgi:hypothetical protein